MAKEAEFGPTRLGFVIYDLENVGLHFFHFFFMREQIVKAAVSKLNKKKVSLKLIPLALE